MTVNFTLVVQAVNFFIAYLLFRFLFFKPGVQILFKEEEDRVMLNTIIEHYKKELVDAEVARQELWRSCQQFFVAHMPADIKKSMVVTKDETPTTFFQVEFLDDTKELVKEAAEKISEEIGGDY